MNTKPLDPAYCYGAYLIAIPSWAAGTALGVLAGNALPARIVSALSVALFGMFLAIIVPPAKKDKVVLGTVIAGFVLFRAPTPAQGFGLLGAMFSFAAAPETGRMAAESILTPDRIVWMGLGILFSFPVVPWALRKLETRPWWEIGKNALALLGLIVCVLSISGGSFSPFIYQQF